MDRAHAVDDLARRIDDDFRVAGLQLRHRLLPDLARDDDAVGAILKELRPFRIGEGEERHLLAVLLERDLELLELRSGRLDSHLEGCGQSHELVGLRDLDGGSRHPAGVEECTACREQQNQYKSEQESHQMMIPVMAPGVRRLS